MECPSVWIRLMLPHDLCILGRHAAEAMPRSLSVLYQEAHGLGCPVTSDVNVYQPVKMVSAKFLHCEVNYYSTY